MFVGSVEEVKGLTVKVVVYVPFFRSQGSTMIPLVDQNGIVSRSSPYYKAVSRSSCEVNVLQIVLDDQMMESTGIPIANTSTLQNQKHQETLSKYRAGNTGKSPVMKRH